MPRWTVSLPSRLDAFLATEDRMLSRAQAQKAVEEGRVLINDTIAKKSSARLQEGDTVTLTEDQSSHDPTIQPVDLHLEILYEDSSCLVINKPAGIAVHPGSGMTPGEITILHGIAHLFQERSLPFSEASVLVHRLDKETTGCLLIAKTPEAHHTLQKQFEDRTVSKTYLALVAGVPSPAAAMIDAPIGRSTSNRTKMSVLKTSKTRESQTTYRTLAVSPRGDSALLACDLHTGRTHQIRVHLSTIGHPILGDGSYRSSLSERLAEEYEIRNLCLHAWKLSFKSPADGKEHQIATPFSDTLLSAMQRLDVSLEK